MADADLIFGEPANGSPGNAIDLVFGSTESGGVNTRAVIAVDLTAAPTLAIRAGTGIAYSIAGDLSGALPTLAMTVTYDLAVSRGPRRTVGSPWQPASTFDVVAGSVWESSKPLPKSFSQGLVDAKALPHVARGAAWDEAQPTRISARTGFEEAAPLEARSTTVPFQQGRAARLSRGSRWQEGKRTRPATTSMAFEEARRVRGQNLARYESARAVRRQVTSKVRSAAPAPRSWVVRWQEAAHPMPGKAVIVVPPPPPPDRCYTPPIGDAVPLVFSARRDGSTDLIFFCDNHPPAPPDPTATIVVPVRKFYMVTNSASLINVTTGDVIPTLSMRLSLDVDSWTWTFNASVPGAALSAVQPSNDGTPTEVQATVNGVPYRFYVEGISRDRTFGQSVLSLSGRGRTAALDAPYAPVQSFTNTTDRTAQQLVADVLTDNGVSMGWDVTWNPTDWLVPAGVFNVKGSYIAAINAIAAACGAYVQPHNTDQGLSILLRYPTAPWDWAAATPDFELPSAVTQRESIAWAENARYNRVWVSGQQQGVLARVTRTGTAGDLSADTITDPLITDVIAARQRALPTLAATGRIATVGLRMPVLQETGIIPPGKLVRYVDGNVTRLGLSRAVSVDVSMPTVYQTISLETHA